MKQRRRLAVAAAAALAVALLSLPVAAGEKGKCTADTQTCLNKMASMFKDRGWIGIEMEEKKDSGLPVVNRIVAGSPAEAAGFRIGDVLVSVEGVKFADNTGEACATCAVTKKNWVPGRKVKYVVSRGGSEVVVEPVLAQVPTDVLAQWIGQHMLEHAEVEVAKK